MALSEDLDSLCTQQLFRAAESLKLDEFDCILSQTSDVELSALCTPGPSLSARTGTDPSRLLEPHPQYQLLSSTHQESSIAVSSNRFTAPTTDADVQAVQSSAVPKNTSKSTSWAVNIWKEWTAHRRKVCHPLDCPPTPSAVSARRAKPVVEQVCTGGSTKRWTAIPTSDTIFTLLRSFEVCA